MNMMPPSALPQVPRKAHSTLPYPIFNVRASYPFMAKQRIPLAQVHLVDQLGPIMQLVSTENVLQGDAADRSSKGAER